ncbi:phosphatases II [Agrocybe pediades]|nr:phosphatases II [Agrocybe pediades]
MLSFPAQNWEKALRATKASLERKQGSGRAATRVIPRLYISDYWTSTNAEKMNELGITHIISLLDFKPLKVLESIPLDRRLQITIRDAPDSNILQHLDNTTAFIKQALEENSENQVLVHCMQGISRSATVVCAYLIATTDMTAAASIEYLQSVRGIVCPNNGFRHQLKEYEARYRKDISLAAGPSTFLGFFKLGALSRKKKGAETLVGTEKDAKT